LGFFVCVFVFCVSYDFLGRPPRIDRDLVITPPSGTGVDAGGCIFPTPPISYFPPPFSLSLLFYVFPPLQFNGVITRSSSAYRCCRHLEALGQYVTQDIVGRGPFPFPAFLREEVESSRRSPPSIAIPSSRHDDDRGFAQALGDSYQSRE